MRMPFKCVVSTIFAHYCVQEVTGLQLRKKTCKGVACSGEQAELPAAKGVQSATTSDSHVVAVDGQAPKDKLLIPGVSAAVIYMAGVCGGGGMGYGLTVAGFLLVPRLMFTFVPVINNATKSPKQEDLKSDKWNDAGTLKKIEIVGRSIFRSYAILPLFGLGPTGKADLTDSIQHLQVWASLIIQLILDSFWIVALCRLLKGK